MISNVVLVTDKDEEDLSLALRSTHSIRMARGAGVIPGQCVPSSWNNRDKSNMDEDRQKLMNKDHLHRQITVNKNWQA
jgi:hypothetical protein